MKKNDVSIITVNYNGLEDTRELICSLREYLSFPYELIVVDNGSKQNEAVLLHELFPEIKVIRSEKNLGFAGGNNLGIKEARGEVLLFLNNDTFIQDDSITCLTEYVKNSSSTTAGASPKILFASPPNLIQFAGYTLLSRITLRNRLIGYLTQDNGQFDQQQLTPYLHGAAMCLKRAVIDQVGLIPEVYFLYYEELDWCTRINTSGYTLSYIPQAKIFHKESSSVGTESPLKVYYMTRNRLLYAWRNRKGLPFYFAMLYLIIFAYPKNFIKFLFEKRPAQAKAVFRGIKDFFLMNK